VLTEHFTGSIWHATL